MANSAKSRDRLRWTNEPGAAVRLFQSFVRLKKAESDSQNSNISRGPSNNDKLSEDKSKLVSHSRKYADQQDTPDTQTSRHRQSKYHKNFSNFDEYNINSGHDDRLNKSYEISVEDKSSNPLSGKLSKPIQYPRSYNKSNDCDKYIRRDNYDIQNSKKFNHLNSSSHVDTSCRKNLKYDSRSKHDNTISRRDFNKDYPKFKEVSHFQKYPDNTKSNNFKCSQYNDSYKYRNPPKNVDQYSQSDKIKSDFKLDQGDIEEDCFSDDNLNLENHFEDENKEVKYQRSFIELDETIMNGFKNMKVTLKQSPDLDTNSSSVSSPSLISPVSNLPDPTILSASLPSVTSAEQPASNTLSESVISNTPPDFSQETVLENNSNLSLSCVFDDPSLTNNSIGILISSNGFIPAPVSSDSPSSSEKICPSAGKNGVFLQNCGAESTEVDSNADAHFSLPNSEHLEAISNFILKVFKERLAYSSDAVRVVSDLNRLFKNHFEGNVIDYYGSYYCDLAITTSDINLMIKADVSIKKSFMNEIYKVLSEELEGYHVHHYEEGNNACKSKINFTHPNTGINCELAYLGRNLDKYLKMGNFLKQMCTKDSRTKQLIIAVKVWAEHFYINDAEDGKLHPVGFALSVIHFLQHCENPVLPIYSDEVEFQDMESLPKNNSSVGELWLCFLWYYAFTFNWQEDVLTVTSLDRVSKKSKNWDAYWIAIEDPFTGKNIASSVINMDVANNIKSYFKITYNYFLSGPEIIPVFENEGNQSNKESSSQLEFSFNDCFLEQEEDICEMCYEIDDICDECKKKNYVQPVASLPKMTEDFLEVIEKALLTVYKKYMLSDKEELRRRKFVKMLEDRVRKIYSDAQLKLFGSSSNGFGLIKSDIDICMTFKSGKEHKANSVLRDLRRLLQRDEDFLNVIAIFNAQIPILKFRYKPEGWRGDISLNNVLAVHNSELLYTYSLIDERCKILGCALKLIAKKAQIADVTEKALSSYSYLIMVIHFLQQTDPPVLPVLQDNEFREVYELDAIFEECNIWFCKDIDFIKEKFRTKKNDTRVGQLFLDLLDYYCSFDNNQVVTIRQKEKLDFSEKMRLARLFHIQDPFLATKNLGCVVSPSKARETENVFKNARRLFGTPKKEIPDDLENYFFSSMSLTNRILKDDFCDFCGKFGHVENDCKNKCFKSFPRKFNYTYRNNINKRKQFNRQYFKK